jgi:hypothetical protein
VLLSRKCLRDRLAFNQPSYWAEVERFVINPAGVSNKLCTVTGSSEVTVKRHLPLPSPMPPASPFAELPFSSCAAVISLTEPPERLKVRLVPGLGFPASSMPEILTAAESDPLLMTLSLLA